MSRQCSRLEAQLETMLAAWRGEPVGEDPVDGSPRLSATPEPFSRPHPLIFLGGGAPAARRAGRLGSPLPRKLEAKDFEMSSIRGSQKRT